jgi:DNA-binding CsgD family transcriptional regulator
MPIVKKLSVCVEQVPPTRSCSLCGKDFDAPGPTESDKQRLTAREWQVSNLISQAKSNKIIAFELGLTEGTVKEYLYQIFRKLQVTNRTELAILWARSSSVKCRHCVQAPAPPPAMAYCLQGWQHRIPFRELPIPPRQTGTHEFLIQVPAIRRNDFGGSGCQA